MSVSTATAVIDLKALVNNYKTIKSYAPNSNVLAVLKANAYGHGLELIAKALPQADAFGVARLGEAILLREAGITQPIVLLEGFFSIDELDLLVEHNLDTVIHNNFQLAALIENQLAKPLKVWLKIDTGMHRLGINPDEFPQYFNALCSNDNVKKSIVLMSHLGCADDTSNSITTFQTELFNSITSSLAIERSLANSAGIFAWPNTHYDWVRPGLMLYGISPMLLSTDKTLDFNLINNSYENKIQDIQPVMTLKSSLIAIKTIKCGESVGYGASWTSTKSTIIGVVAIGYGDGYPRHAKNGTPVYVNGRIVPLVGRVSMDMITVDLGEQFYDEITAKNINNIDKIGDEVILWGAELPVETVAKHATTIPYELLCNISRRVHIIVE